MNLGLGIVRWKERYFVWGVLRSLLDMFYFTNFGKLSGDIKVGLKNKCFTIFNDF